MPFSSGQPTECGFKKVAEEQLPGNPNRKTGRTTDDGSRRGTFSRVDESLARVPGVDAVDVEKTVKPRLRDGDDDKRYLIVM